MTNNLEVITDAERAELMAKRAIAANAASETPIESEGAPLWSVFALGLAIGAGGVLYATNDWQKTAVAKANDAAFIREQTAVGAAAENEARRCTQQLKIAKSAALESAHTVYNAAIEDGCVRRMRVNGIPLNKTEVHACYQIFDGHGVIQ